MNPYLAAFLTAAAFVGLLAALNAFVKQPDGKRAFQLAMAALGAYSSAKSL